MPIVKNVLDPPVPDPLIYWAFFPRLRLNLEFFGRAVGFSLGSGWDR